MALPPEPPLDAPDPAPTPPVGSSALSPGMVELAESVKKFRQAYQSRGRMPGSQKQVEDLRALSKALSQRMLQEINRDPDYRLARTNPNAASEAQHSKAKLYDGLLKGIVGIQQQAEVQYARSRSYEEAFPPPVEAQRVPARGSEELTEDEAQAGSGTVVPPRPDFIKEGRRIEEPQDGPSDKAMLEKYGKPKEADAAEAVAKGEPSSSKAKPDTTPEVEEAPEAPKVEAAPISPEKAAPEEIPEAAAEVEGAPEAEEETVDDSTPDWIKELGEDDDETLNAYQRAQKERRAAVEKALAPKQEPIPLHDPSKPPRVEPIPTYDPDTDTARQVPLELGESQQPEEDFGETEVDPLLGPQSAPGPVQGPATPPLNERGFPAVDMYGEPVEAPEGDYRDSEAPWDEEYGESDPDEDYSASGPEEEYGESQQEEEPSGPSPEMSTPDARKAAVEKAMRPKQAAKPQSIKAPQGARVIKGDGGWSYAIMPNKDIRIIRAPKGHRPGMLLKSGSKGPWSAIANKFGIGTTPEETTKVGWQPDTPPTPETPKAGTKKKGVGAALKRLLGEGIEMPKDTPGI